MKTLYKKMSFIKKVGLFHKKYVSSLFLSLLLLTVFFIPKTTHASLFPGVPDISFDLIQDVFGGSTDIVTVGVQAPATVINTANTTAFNVKTFLLDGIAVAFARMAVQGLTAQTVNWINTGFKGNPAYVTDPGQFFTNLGDQAVVSALGSQGNLLSKICTPFKPQLRLALVSNYLQQGQMGQCSIQSIVKNYDAFTQDFAQGGWKGWFAMTQTNANNPYGAYFEGQDVLSRSVANKLNTYEKQINNGKGFLNFEKCPAGKTWGEVAVKNIEKPVGFDETFALPGATTGTTGGIGDLANDPAIKKATENLANENVADDPNGCSVAKQTVTPGSVISDQLGKILGSPVDQYNVTNSINQIVSALMVQGFKAVVGGIGNGLRGLSQGDTSQPKSLATQLNLAADPTTPEGKAANQATLTNIKSSIGAGSSVAKAIDPTDPGPTTPDVDRAAIKAQVKEEMDGYRVTETTTTGGTTTGNVPGAKCVASTGIQSIFDSNGVCME